MKNALTVVACLVSALLAIEPLLLSAVEAQGLTFTVSTDKATYRVGSRARVMLRLDSTTPVTGVLPYGGLGCQFNVIILDAERTPLFDSTKGIDCPQAEMHRSIPPAMVARATIPLRNNLTGRGDLAPGLYIMQGILRWFRLISAGEVSEVGSGPFAGEVVIEIIP